jgi:hypothetical protein
MCSKHIFKSELSLKNQNHGSNKSNKQINKIKKNMSLRIKNYKNKNQKYEETTIK